jgi:hypothetical protein
MACLEDRLEIHHDLGTQKVVFVCGEPGIAKTTFVRAFIVSIAVKKAVRIAHGQCVEQGAGEPYLPVPRH